MKGMDVKMEKKKWTIMELKKHVNSLSFEELDKFKQEFDVQEFDEDLDIVTLLEASKLYDYLKYKKGDDLVVELGGNCCE